MKNVILLTNHYEGNPKTILEKCAGDDLEIRMLPKAEREELLRMIPEADYLLVSGRLKIDREVLNRAKKLKMIQRTGVGLDNVDPEAIQEAGVPLYVNRGVNANSVAEYTLTLMLAALKRTWAVNLQMRQGIWKKQETGLRTRELAGKTVGLIGMGHIGQRVARMLIGFDTKTIYYDIVRLPVEKERDLKLVYVSWEELLQGSDIISLHCSYSPGRGSLITRKELAMMKDQVILINTARGKLICQADLVEALRNGKIGACGLDVFEEEPLAEALPLDGLDSVLLSPHIAGLSYEAFSGMMRNAVDNIRAFDRGQLQQIEERRYKW